MRESDMIKSEDEIKIKIIKTMDYAIERLLVNDDVFHEYNIG